MPDASPARISELPSTDANSAVSRSAESLATFRRSPRWLGLATLAIAVGALALAIAAWFRPIPEQHNPHPVSTTPTFTAQQVADAKAKVCEAYKTVRQAVVTSTNRADPKTSDQINELPIAINARLALYGGGDYLLKEIEKGTAAPYDLKDRVSSLANTFQVLAINYLAEKSGTKLDQLRQRMEIDTRAIDQPCK